MRKDDLLHVQKDVFTRARGQIALRYDGMQDENAQEKRTQHSAKSRNRYVIRFSC